MQPSERARDAESKRNTLRGRARFRSGAVFGALLMALGACGKEDQTAPDLIWRCDQFISTLLSAHCACTGYTPGTEAQWVGNEVASCDLIEFACCFIGDAPLRRDGTPDGVQECRCVKAGVCDAEMAARPGVTRVDICPPAAE